MISGDMDNHDASMIENFLTGVWRARGLAGATPADAFSVSVGLARTMTPVDIPEGYPEGHSFWLPVRDLQTSLKSHSSNKSTEILTLPRQKKSGVYKACLEKGDKQNKILASSKILF